MYPLSDNDLDRLSRDAAEHFDVPSSASGWDRLESRLDQELPVREKDRKRFFFWLFVVALLTGGSLVYMLGRSPNGNNLAAENEKVNKENVVSSKKNVNEKSAIIDQRSENERSSPDADKTAVRPEQRLSKTANADQLRATASRQQRSHEIAARKAKDANQKLADQKSRNLPANNKSESDQLISRKHDLDKQPAIEFLKPSVPAIVSPDLTYKVGDPAKEPQPVLAAEPPAIKPPATQTAKWEFGLLTGPDFNNVKFKHSSKAGLNMGVTIGYRISERWLVNTGFIYTKKWYKADGEDFHPPKHSYLSYQDIQMVEGNCNMFEIPVNLRYDFSVNNKRRLFASAGLSSFIMDKQNYECDYISGMNGQPYKYKWSEDSNYTHVMSNLNLSFGYERALGRNFSIQAEPYLKLPLKGLGYGSLKMNSYGLYVTFKYKPLGKKN
jgi:hypothetical protein